MNIKNVFEKLKSLGLPAVYGNFSEKPESSEYVTISSPSSSFSGSDNGKAIVETLQIEINLYTKSKKLDLEYQILELIMSENDISRNEIYISDENILENTFSFNTTNKLYKEWFLCH